MSVRTWSAPGTSGRTSRGTGKIAFESLTYGVLPSRQAYDRHYKAIVGSDDYEMALVGEDARVVETAWGGAMYVAEYNKAGYRLDRDELWQLLKMLVEAFEEGDEAAGDLASGILQTLHFEWI